MGTSLITRGNIVNCFKRSRSGWSQVTVRDFSWTISPVAIQLCWNIFALVCVPDTPKQQLTLVSWGLCLYLHSVPCSMSHRPFVYAGVFQSPSQAPKELPLSIGFILLQLCHLGRCHVENAIKANTDTAGNVLGNAKASLCSLPEALLSISIPLPQSFLGSDISPS